MTEPTAYPSGTDLRLLLQNCQCGDDLMRKPGAASPLVRKAIQSVGFQDLTEANYAFDEGGYTLAIVLAESHLVIHTWPEFDNLVLVDISVCNYLRPNRERTLQLGEEVCRVFQPKQHLVEESSMAPRLQDKLIAGHGYYVEIDKLVDSRKSEFQSITVADTPVFGRSLVIDGVLQVSEADSAFYHEPLVHVPLLAHPNPQSVMICGGGDGVAAKDALLHPSVERCVIVDIDPEVVEVSRQTLQTLHQGALDDPRVEIRIQNAKEHLAHLDRKYDVILIDSTDPVGCGEALFTQDFYQNLSRCLADDGWLSLHVGSPYIIEAESARAAAKVYQAFHRADPYLQYVPSYASVMGFMLCQNRDERLPGPGAIQERIEERGLDKLELLTPETYAAMFAIPPKLRHVFPHVASRVFA
ncbi:MAG: polyamine aminopropyltransferase [Candidatus Hinthialibacter antarcticus]|nr:polyamine aminopropyltransferase [Candidatus Hinthialibacter antarcticus]